MLVVDRLSHVYADGTRALDAITLPIEPGLFGLLGPNGAGKSTLMRILATVQSPSDAGQIRLDEIDMLADPLRLRRSLGYLPQEFGVYPHVSVFAMLDHLALLKGVAGRAERRDLVDHLLREVHLHEVRHKALASLSGGMRQRFGLAQALIGAPRLIIVDEPTAGLDPEERFRALDLLAAAAQNAIVILSTHIVADVASLCERMAILAGGRLLMTGSPTALVEALAGRVWRKQVERSELAGLGDRLLSSRLVTGRIVAHVLSEHSPGAGFEPVEATLEDGYFAALARRGG
ncbi:ATP-binding cassette domain-containing protein [Allosphingosinicella deserti]|uniref:Multidrug ABC transporter ATP-binding protein n=1 Tax=Allosphingosinicella deserti TaxID=2116704 RepID=A0A2P7QYV1_9SPHN|nr:ATP-binding cassette domain-containing protein [Sphingomonas deserti]PSJ43129.1 multidrug ABC transporter ATP-binding protein [Sphingomonas deserti]